MSKHRQYWLNGKQIFYNEEDGRYMQNALNIETVHVIEYQACVELEEKLRAKEINGSLRGYDGTVDKLNETIEGQRITNNALKKMLSEAKERSGYWAKAASNQMGKIEDLEAKLKIAVESLQTLTTKMNPATASYRHTGETSQIPYGEMNKLCDAQIDAEEALAKITTGEDEPPSKKIKAITDALTAMDGKATRNKDEI